MSLVVHYKSQWYAICWHWDILFTEKPVIIPFTFGGDVVNQGDFVQITCVVTRGDRPLSITWSLKGDIVSSDPTLTTTMLGTQASMLVISSVDYQHSGVYTCRAENSAGISSYSTELKVNGMCWKALKIILFTELPEIVPFSFGGNAINQGQFAQLTCVVTKGDKPLSITWSLKGDVINSDPTLTTTMLGTQVSMLVISSVDYTHSGVYTCRAENPAGISTHSTELLVNGNYWERHWDMFYLQNHLRLFLLHLDLKVLIRENMLNWLVWSEVEINL